MQDSATEKLSRNTISMVKTGFLIACLKKIFMFLSSFFKIKQMQFQAMQRMEKYITSANRNRFSERMARISFIACLYTMGVTAGYILLFEGG